MLKTLASRVAAGAAVLAIGGASYAALPSGTAIAAPEYCELSAPDVRATVTITAVPGVSATRADLLNVKVQNTTNKDCIGAIVVVTPREGTVFGGIVSTTGGWSCEGPGIGNEGVTTCYNSVLPKYSQQTLKIRYNRATPGGPVSGTASAEVLFEGGESDTSDTLQ